MRQCEIFPKDCTNLARWRCSVCGLWMCEECADMGDEGHEYCLFDAPPVVVEAERERRAYA